MSRQGGPLRDIRSRIRHENHALGSGAGSSSSLGSGLPSSSALASAAAAPTPNSSASSMYGAPSSQYRDASPSAFQPEDAHAPLRPARSMRRPQQAPVPPTPGTARTPGTGGSSLQIPPPSGGGFVQSGPPSPRALGPSNGQRSGRDLLTAGRAGPASGPRSAMMLDRMARGGRETPVSAASSEGELDEAEDAYGGISPTASFARGGGPGSPQTPATGGTLGSLTHAGEPAALGTVIAALSAAGRKHQAARIARGGARPNSQAFHEEEKAKRLGEKRFEGLGARESRPLQEYMRHDDEKGFREINAVLRKVKAEWAFMSDDDFNSVSLALSLLDDSSLGASRDNFEAMKAEIEGALQGTVDDHYESFATAITLHNSVLASLTASQGSVSAARRRLRDSREALGAKRADLVQMWGRAQGVKESLRLLDVVEHLKSVPDRLESLMSEKRFLQAVLLLTRSLKTIDKAEIVEVGATVDLRAYLKGQEQAMLDILIEELHNHLYLKSYFCDSRWKSYASGQQSLPSVEFGREYDHAEMNAPAAEEDGTAGTTGTTREKPLKMARYLNSLNTRPSFDPYLSSDLPDMGGTAMTSSLSSSGLAMDSSNVPMSAGMTASKSTDSSLSALAGTNGLAADLAAGAADFEQNPESDSFFYIEMLLESLARLGKLGLALDVVAQRLPVELHQLVDATIDEVDERNEPLRRSSVVARPESILLASSTALARSFSETSRSSFSTLSLAPSSGVMRLSAGESSALQRDGEIMRDLFWTLFSKLDAVLQGHRVVYEVAGKISSRPGFKDSSAISKASSVSSLVEVWRPIQNEVRTLLHDHLMDDNQSSSSGRNPIISINEVLRNGRFGRDRSKQLFKFSDSSIKSGRKELGPLRRHEEALTQALRASVPGLVSSLDTGGGSAVGGAIGGGVAQQQQVIVSSMRTDEQYAGAAHRLLVKPDAFNVSVLFQPALAFIDRVQEVMPSEAAGETSKGFSAFLDEFVQDVFLPQLEDKVQSLFQSAVGGPDAFQEDAASRRLSQRPVVKSVANVVVLVDSLYSMLRTTPFHRESYSRLIIMTIVQYYQRCNERFRDLVSADMVSSPTSPSPSSTQSSTAYMLSAAWAQRPEINSCLTEAVQPETDSARKRELYAQENRFEMQLASKPGTVALTDLITSRKKMMALGNLHHSLQWFLGHISRFKATDETLPTAPAAARLSVANGIEPKEEAEDELKLPLGRDMAARFEALPKTYRHLSTVILFTLRMELRARTIHYLDLAISEGNYMVEDAALEPDPHVVDLNAELATCDEIYADTVAPEQHKFLFEGLASLMDALVVSAVRRVRAINRHGVTKMLRNILALQQNLKNIVDEPLEVDFEKSKRFWELLSKEPGEMLDAIKASGSQHTFDEYKSALNLMLGLDNVGKDAATPTSAAPGLVAAGAGTTGKGEVSRRKFNEYLIELHEVAGSAA